MIGEMVFEVVGEEARKLTWPGYGFQLEVPHGALPAGTTASVAVKAIQSGQFQFPEGSHLISTIYWIASSEVFKKEVAVRVQHCAVIPSEEELANFKFIIARCNQRELPYKFREREGEFTVQSQLAIIKLKQFSFIGVVLKSLSEWFKIRYTYHVFYQQRTPANADMIFVVSKALEATDKVNYTTSTCTGIEEYCQHSIRLLMTSTSRVGRTINNLLSLSQTLSLSHSLIRRSPPLGVSVQ